MASSNASPAVAWSTARFSETIESLNAAVQQGKVQRDQSVLARKSLAETTKQFKRSVKVAETASSNLATSTSTTSSSAEQDSVLSAVEALSKECRVTIKAYQEEVDNLTRRCKGSEQACTTVLTALLGLPDPAPLLLVQQQQTLQDEQQHKQVIHALEQELERSRRENLDQQQQYQKLLQKEAKEQSNAPTDTSMSNSEREELSALRKEVAEYEIEFRSLKNQDITIRKLEDRIFELQTAGEESIRHAIDQARSELAYTEGRRAQEALEREAATEAKLQTLELQLRSERAGREATQNAMISADNAVNHQQAAWEAQRQILVDDNERVREALETLKLERDGLTNNANYNNNTNNAMTNYASNSAFLKPANAPISGGTTTSALPMSGNSGGIAAFQDLLLERNAYEAEVSELSDANAMLREEMRQTVVQLQDAHRDFQIKADQWDRERSTLNSTLASLESQLSNAPSQSMVESMQRELRVLKRLEYNAEHDSTDDTASECREPEIAGGSTEDATELEAVLIAKVRRAEKDLIAERNSKTDLENSTRELQKALTDAEKSKEALDQLVASLEKDLERAIATPASLQLPIQQFGSSNSQQRLVASVENPAVLEHILDPTLPPPDTRQKTTPTAPVGTTTVTTETTPDDHSVATIVMAQRDRLRARCEALEAERDSFKRELQGQVQASESLKADNTKLYEKVRYLHNYSKLSGVGSGNLSAGGGKAYLRSGTSGGGDRDLDLEALEQRYEASVDPFKQFNKSERQRKLDEMSPMERTVFVVAKTVLSTKEMRTSLFFYVVALHLLVFVTTYNWSHQGCDSFYLDKEHLSHLPPVTPAHIIEQQQQGGKPLVASKRDSLGGG